MERNRKQHDSPRRTVTEVCLPTRRKQSVTVVGDKNGKVLRLLARPKGATVKEIQRATGWKPHSVRAWLSTFRHGEGVKVHPHREGQDTRYQIAA